MTISSTNRKAGPYTGNGSASAFPFAFKVFTASDLYVVKTNTTLGADAVLVLGADYTVSLNADQNANPGGTITLTAGALASSYNLTITSSLAYLQPTDLTNQGAFYPSVITNALDRLTIFCQQLYDAVSRSLKVSVSTPSGVQTTLPPPAANKLIGWNATADNLQNTDPATLATIVAFGTTNADKFSGDGATTPFVLSANPGALNNLDVSIGGVSQRPGIDFTWTSGTTINFTTAPPVGVNNILVRYMQGLPQGYTAADLVQYTPSGAGTVQTDVQTVLRETVSLKRFGAKGDGATDDTAAVNLAKSYMAATGNNVIVTPGVYLCDPFAISGTAYAGQANFVGMDRERCIIRRRTAGAGAFVTYGSASGTVFQSGIGFENLTIDGGATTNGDAFVAYDLVRSQFSNVRFSGGAIGCHLYGGISLSFYSCLFDMAKTGLRIEKFSSLAGGGWPNAVRVVGGEIVDNVELGVYFDDGRMLLIDGTEIEGNGTSLGAALQGGVYVGANVGAEVSVTDSTSIGLTMRGCWLEANRGAADIALNSGINSISDSNFFSQSTMVTNDIVINGGKYMLRNINMSFSKTANVLENGGALAGNVIENVEAANLSYSGAKTAVLTGAWINLQQGRVPSINGMTAPMILTGTDSSSANPTITFSAAFKSGTTPLVLCQAVNNSSGTVDEVETYAISRTGFSMRKKSYNGTAITTSNYTVTWVAIGESP